MMNMLLRLLLSASTVLLPVLLRLLQLPAQRRLAAPEHTPGWLGHSSSIAPAAAAVVVVVVMAGAASAHATSAALLLQLLLLPLTGLTPLLPQLLLPGPGPRQGRRC